MNINKYLNSFDFASNLTRVKDLLNKTSSEVNFWGKQVVVIKEYTGSFPLDILVYKVLIASYGRLTSGDLTIEERKIGKSIADDLSRLDLTANRATSESGCCTRFLRWIRTHNFFPFSVTVDDTFIEAAKYNFRAINPENLLKLMSKNDEDSPCNSKHLISHPLYAGKLGDKVLLNL